MKRISQAIMIGVPGLLAFILFMVPVYGKDSQPSSYAPVVIKEAFQDTMERMKKNKKKIMQRQMDLLKNRYDLSNRPAKGVMMSGKRKPVQEGVRVKLGKGMTWDELAQMSPEQIKAKDLWPQGFYPLPHPNHPEGGMVFPEFHITEILKQESRDRTLPALIWILIFPIISCPNFQPPFTLQHGPI